MRIFGTIFSALLIFASVAYLDAMELLEDFQRERYEFCEQPLLLPVFEEEEGYGSKIEKPSSTINPAHIHLRALEQNQPRKRRLIESTQIDESSTTSVSSSSVQSLGSDSDYSAYCESASSKSRKTESTSSSSSSKIVIKVEPRASYESVLEFGSQLAKKSPYDHIMHMCTFAKCTKVFESLQDFTDHVEEHLHGTPYPCIRAGCAQAFEKIGDWIHHMHSHMGPVAKKKALRAPIISLRNAADYSISPEEIEKLPFDCIRPGCTVSNKTVVEWIEHHQSLHETAQSYPCLQKDCNVIFSKASDLVYHMRNHSEQKPYVCTHEGCGMKFSREIALHNHSAEHARNKYVCSTPGCHKIFQRLGRFTYHKKICKFQVKIEPQEEWAT